MNPFFLAAMMVVFGQHADHNGDWTYHMHVDGKWIL